MRLKDAIQREVNVPIRLRAGAPGALEVFVDGEQIYSKKKTGRMPSAEQLIGPIRSRLAASGP